MKAARHSAFNTALVLPDLPTPEFVVPLIAVFIFSTSCDQQLLLSYSVHSPRDGRSAQSTVATGG